MLVVKKVREFFVSLKLTRQRDSIKVGIPWSGLPWRVSADICFPGASGDKRKSLGYGGGQKGGPIIQPGPQKGDPPGGVSLVYYTVLLCEGQPVVRGTQNNHLSPTHLAWHETVLLILAGPLTCVQIISCPPRSHFMGPLG